jgi:Tol biopolymer transport system component
MKKRLAAIGLVMAFALSLGSIASADTAPVSVTPRTGTIASPAPFTINDGDGDQGGPRISGNLVAYTSEDNGMSEVRVHNLADGTDVAIPGASFTALDFLPEIDGDNVVYTHVTDSQVINRYDAGTGAVSTLGPATSALRTQPAIGGSTVAWIEFATPTDSGHAQIVAYDLDTAAVTNITNDTLANRLPAVSPDGNTIVWQTCQPDLTGCYIRESTRTGTTWSAPIDLTTATDGEAGVQIDTDGAIVVYSLTAPGGDEDIYWQPVGGGQAHRLVLPERQTAPSVSNGVISFAAFQTGAPLPDFDIDVYDVASNTLYPVTNTTNDELLNDISVAPDRTVTAVWARSGATYDVAGASFALPTLPSALSLSPADGSQAAGSDAAVTAAVTDSADGPVAGVTVEFVLTGAVTATGSCTTAADGTCIYTYDGPTTAGNVAIAAYVDTDGDGQLGAGEPQASATREFEDQQVTYIFSGFAWPVVNPPTVNYTHARGVVPLRWRLSDSDGAPLNDLSVVDSLTYQAASCTTFDPLTASSPVDAASAGRLGLHLDGPGSFHFNWKTPHDAGCYSVSLTLDSGQVFQANFNLHRPSFFEHLGDGLQELLLRLLRDW